MAWADRHRVAWRARAATGPERARTFSHRGDQRRRQDHALAAREVLGRQDLAVPSGDHPPRRPDGAHRGGARQVAKCAAFRLPAAPLDEQQTGPGTLTAEAAASHPGRCRGPTRSVLGAEHPPPPQPPRRPPTQPSAGHPQPLLPPHPGLHRQTNRRRQNPPRSPTLEAAGADACVRGAVRVAQGRSTMLCPGSAAPQTRG